VKDAIYTFATDVDNNYCFKMCTESIARYAGKIEVDFIIGTDYKIVNDDLKTDSHKLNILELLKYYDRVLYLDGDVFIRKDSPDIFAWYRNCGDFLIYNEVLYNGIDMDKYIQKAINDNGLEVWGKTNGHYDWLNSGVMLFRKGHEKVLEYNKEDYFKFPDMPLLYDMPSMTYRISKYKIPTTFLDKKFNTMVYFEDDGWFLHFANVLDRNERIKKYEHE